MVDSKVVRERGSWWYVALGYTYRSVHLVRAILEQPVEVQTRALVPELDNVSRSCEELFNMAYLVVHVHDDSFTFSDVDGWDGPFSIDSNDRSVVHAIWVTHHPTHRSKVSTHVLAISTCMFPTKLCSSRRCVSLVLRHGSPTSSTASLQTLWKRPCRCLKRDIRPWKALYGGGFYAFSVSDAIQT